jgi:hypothetical protein
MRICNESHDIRVFAFSVLKVLTPNISDFLSKKFFEISVKSVFLLISVKTHNLDKSFHFK